MDAADTSVHGRATGGPRRRRRDLDRKRSRQHRRRKGLDPTISSGSSENRNPLWIMFARKGVGDCFFPGSTRTTCKRGC